MSHSPVERLLSRLDSVKQTRHGRYIARCPAHSDRSPSLALREMDDGTLLLHCFAGCDVADVVRSVGLNLADLFPNSDGSYKNPQRRPFSATDLLELAAWESLVASIIALDLAEGRPGADRERLLKAAQRLRHMAEVGNGKH